MSRREGQHRLGRVRVGAAVEAVHAERPLQPNDRTLDGLQEKQRADPGGGKSDRE